MKELDHVYISSLVTLAKKNDSNAFAELYGLTYPNVYNYACHYLKDQYLAQDAVQETYILAFKKLTALNDATLFVAWLNQIAFHVCYRLAQKRNDNYGTIDDEIIELICDEKLYRNPEGQTIHNDIHKSLHEAIEQLPIQERQVIILRFFNEMKIDEIVDATNLSKSTVKRYLGHAQETLKQKMIEAGGVSFV